MNCTDCGKEFVKILETQTICRDCLDNIFERLANNLENITDDEHNFVIRKTDYSIYTDSQYSTGYWTLGV